jgi:putative transcriptional regulator
MAEPSVENALRVQRAIQDLTQADLAERAGITRASVNAIEGGRMVPSILLALKLARALGVSVDDLFTLSTDEHPGQ